MPIILGLAVGVVLGALGGGGAILTVPILVYLLGMPAHEATTASLVIVGVAALMAAVPHARRGRLRWRLALTVGALGTAGTWLGSRLSGLVPSSGLLLGFAVLLLVVAAVMLHRGRTAAPSPVSAVQRRSRSAHWILLVVATATAVGVLTGFFGVGGGFVIVPALTVVLGLPMLEAVGTSLVVIALNSATGLAARLSHGISLDWGLVGAFTAAAVVGSVAGAAVSHRLPGRIVQRAFAVFLVVVASYILVRSAAGRPG